MKVLYKRKIIISTSGYVGIATTTPPNSINFYTSGSLKLTLKSNNNGIYIPSSIA